MPAFKAGRPYVPASRYHSAGSVTEAMHTQTPRTSQQPCCFVHSSVLVMDASVLVLNTNFRCPPGAMFGWLTVVCATASATAEEAPPSVAALATAVAAASELLLKVSARDCALARALPPFLRPWYRVLAGPVVGGAMVWRGMLRRPCVGAVKVERVLRSPLRFLGFGS